MSEMKPRVKRINLGFIGSGWEECFVDFRSLKGSELTDIRERNTKGDDPVQIIGDILQQSFIGGQVLDTDDLPMSMTLKELQNLDFESQVELSNQLGGASSPNA